jgi:predicted  nucleic acid-binding Zn-ribbon protein
MKSTRRLFISSLLAIALVSCARHPNEYVGSSSNSAAYVAWTTDSNGHIQGQVQIAQIDATDPTKLLKENASFSGSESGSQLSIVFPLLSSFGGTTWTGSFGNGSLVVNYPNTDGSLSQLSLKYGGLDDYQRAAAAVGKIAFQNEQQRAEADAAAAQVEALRKATEDHDRAMSDASAALADAQQRLQHDISIRPQVVADVNNQLAALRSAQAAKQRDQDEVDRLSQIAQQRQADAQSASKSATTSDQQVEAGQMGAAAGAAQADVGAAEASVGGADAAISSAQFGLRQAQQNLQRLDARILELRGMIAHDRQILSGP